MEQSKSESYTMYGFYKNGTYEGLYYDADSANGKADMVLRHGSIGYYTYKGSNEFNLYEVNADLSPVFGESLYTATIAIYLDNLMKSQTKPDLENTKPSFVAQIQPDGEHLHILQNNEIVIVLKLRHTKFGDKS